MASGTAYRRNKPAGEVLNIYSLKTDAKLYKAPPNRAPNRNPPTTPLLGELPLEILHQVLLDLDINSLGMLRRVNTTTRSQVESLHAYFLLREYASDTLCVMNATKCASYFPIRWLFEELLHPLCRTCPDFGPFLYLPTITRSCSTCILSQPQYQVAPTWSAIFYFGLCQEDLNPLPVIHSPPHYTIRQSMVDVSQARELGLQLHDGSLEKMNEDFRVRLKRRREGLQRARAKQHETGFTVSPRQLLLYRNMPMELSDSSDALRWRLMGTTSFPYWDIRKGVLEPGTYCRACTYRYEEKEGYARVENQSRKPQTESKKAHDRAFFLADIPKHFLHCSAVKENYNFQDRGGPSVNWTFRRPGTDFIVTANGEMLMDDTPDTMSILGGN